MTASKHGYISVLVESRFVTSLAVAERVSPFLRAVYGWMGVGLAMVLVTSEAG